MSQQEICPGLHSSTKFTKPTEIRNYCNFRKIRSSCWALVISGNTLKERGIFLLYLSYLPTKICWRAQRELRILWRFVAKWILAKFVAEKAQRELLILRKLRKLRELRKIAIFVTFIAEQKIVKIEVAFNPGHNWRSAQNKWHMSPLFQRWYDKPILCHEQFILLKLQQIFSSENSFHWNSQDFSLAKNSAQFCATFSMWFFSCRIDYYAWVPTAKLWCNFILVSVFISLCFILIVICCYTQKHKEIKIEPQRLQVGFSPRAGNVAILPKVASSVQANIASVVKA